MTRRTPEASFLYTQTPDRPPLAAVTGNDIRIVDCTYTYNDICKYSSNHTHNDK